MMPRPSLLIAALVSLLTAACATAPQSLPEQAAQERMSDLQALFNDQESIDGPLTLSDAIARAVKYNVDARVELMSQALARRDLDLSSVDLLPSLVATAGYSKRSNVNAFSSESIVSGRQSLEPSTSQEKERLEADATLVWNVLDFGVSYATAHQRADEVLVAEERRRKALQNIVQDVNFAYWQALAAQRLSPEIDALLVDIDDQLQETRDAVSSGAMDPIRGTRDQDTLLTARRDLGRLRHELELARSDLVRLMNVAPGTDFKLAPTEEERKVPEVARAAEDVEETALTQRPELREEDYRRRIDALDVRKAMLRMLPGVEVKAGVSYDSNDFLVNNEWSFAGVRVVWNLFNLFSGPAARAEAESRVRRDDMRRMALSMAVLAQLHVAYERLRVARARYDITSRLADVNERISKQYGARMAAQAGDAMADLAARTRAAITALQSEQAFAELQNAVGRIQNSIGMDPMPAAVQSRDVQGLSEAIAQHQRALDDYLATPLSHECREDKACPEAGTGSLALF